MRAYETVFVLTPVLTHEQVENSVKNYSKFLKENGAEIVHEESMGLKELSYPIAGKVSGHYHLIEFRAEGTLIKILEKTYKRDERVVRHLVVALGKDAISYNERRRLKSQEKEQEIPVKAEE